MQDENYDPDDVTFLIQSLSQDIGVSGVDIPEDPDDRWRLLRAIMNVRGPMQIDPSVLSVQDRLLRRLNEMKGVVDPRDLEFKDGICLWRGDITRLGCDAIVNVANSAMLGCFMPNHACIDNYVHTYAGMQLRFECAGIMRGRREPVGTAIITDAYNLPCGHIIHTVGPTVDGSLTEKECTELGSSYRSCLDLAKENGLKTIAFCCISAGVFGFPQEEAAELAIGTVREFLDENKDMEVIFDVFTDRDEEIYRNILG